MGLASFGLQIGVFREFLYSVLLLNAILGLDLLGLALYRPQVEADGAHFDGLADFVRVDPFDYFSEVRKSPSWARSWASFIPL
jgi:hypothetical protein